MLPRKNRTSRKDFPTQKDRGNRVFLPLFTAVFYEGNTISRASVVVSKKTAKSAVDRNRQRRRFYDILAPYFKILSAPRTVVIYPKADAQKASFSVLNKEIEKALKQAKVV
ncbi:MAG: hypothetical protein COV32_02985 [Candidatus Yonathbacteria bacterium CG10_big_fil_rev_8_21_14_0_10_43_136]|uniref:Ribonuclease P protein component n=2 Tax=Parcubacteria group TaxID=1794811 RepID=A0A2M7Q6S8_9BACT|nr:MAG: hypothetical protein AUK15_00375 [Candidatus Nomurabacteria bacterium CG2_30_43_9]PIQ35615.1 MAG: hypothetical protein COW60_02935 [Candidatus Yonathbacteria bacterium CG17_big_fil_post_rev_8_21_14_2_50_43_9]PIR40527.1 MAG: hypothetical protein COV32_02985 [Candidatus Yonathbacteria bacterium CG10_big_fil_rev_8_21_14_0_10_43_136]PIX57307.1 MAG: hypothetical protein COZ48_01530 [Candidatus Yonathbacteria bacterium CG_4_10_14_3_um_filter_43_12]PIY58674.1 MAG: hypothetical protein COY98_00